MDYGYDSDGRIAKVDLGAQEARFTYDAIGRADYYDLETGTTDYRVDFSYLAGSGGSSTTLVSSIAQGGVTYSYTYDDCGRILSVSDGTYTTSYEYDLIGQLTRVNDQAADDTWVYAYDDGGNIVSKTLYDYTTGTPGTAEDTIAYGYDTTWDDKLTSYDGISITYDDIGNVTNDGEYAYTWEAGHQLDSMTKTGQTLTYKYNQNGLRTYKSDGTIETKYYWTGNKLTHYNRTNVPGIHIYYNQAGRPLVIGYGPYNYYYKLNLQGDVIGILNTSGTEVVSYTYDAWGNPLTCTGSMASTLGADNPLRYRGYIYDTETGLYYLQARYYNPEWGRFISADTVLGQVGGINTQNGFAYCYNNPANLHDKTGEIPSYKTLLSDGGNRIDWVEKVKFFLSPNTYEISGEFQNGVFSGSGSLGGGYSEYNYRMQFVAPSRGSESCKYGVYGKVSGGNADGDIGVGNDSCSIGLRGVADALVITGQAGLQYQDGLGLALRAKTAVLSGRATIGFKLFGWEFEFGVYGDLLDVGANFVVGYFPEEGFKWDAGFSSGWIGYGVIVRIKPEQ